MTLMDHSTAFKQMSDSEQIAQPKTLNLWPFNGSMIESRSHRFHEWEM